jgi:nicotinamide riboside kinase
MITVIGDKEHPLFKDIQNKLNELTLSFETKESHVTPYIKDGSRDVKGTKQIEKYFNELESELKYWYYCSC